MTTETVAPATGDAVAHRDLTGRLCAALLSTSANQPAAGSRERRRWHRTLVDEASKIADLVFGVADDSAPVPLMVEATVTNQLHPPVAGRPDLAWTLGADATGALVTDKYDTETPHLLIAGSSNSGKSTVMHSMLCQLMHNNTPDDLKIWILEPKNELHPYRDVAHVTRFIDAMNGNDPHRSAADLLNDAVAEMQRRYAKMTAHPAKPANITDAADLAAADPDNCADLRFARLVIAIEECANYFAQPYSTTDRETHDEILEAVAVLACQARSVGIHLATATQYPTKDNLPATLKMQCRRIGLRTTSRMVSMAIIDTPGLETITEPGTGMYLDQTDMVSFKGLPLDRNEQATIIAALPKKPPSADMLAAAV